MGPSSEPCEQDTAQGAVIIDQAAGLRPPGFWRRVAATVIDTVTAALLLRLMDRVVALADARPFGGSALAALAFQVACLAAVGTTPGKAILGLAVVRPDGHRPGVARAALRGVLRLVIVEVAWAAMALGSASAWPVLGLGMLAGCLLPATRHAGAAATHDLMSGLRVVRSPERPVLASLAVAVAAIGIGGLTLHSVGGLRAFVVPSRAMWPTVEAGDHVLVWSFLGSAQRPRPGDVVVFTAPRAAQNRFHRRVDDREPATVFLKRVVAVGGDHVRIGDGVLWRNGEAIGEPYTREPILYEWPSPSDRRDTWDDPMSVEDGAYIVPQDYVIVLGDDRNDSVDSHFWGPVPVENIHYRAWLVTSQSRPTRLL